MTPITANLPTYAIFKAMHSRCERSNNESFHRYGGRGISVCERWSSFENFLADMGPAPKGLLLDRRDNDGNYEPANCQWVTRAESARNTRRNIFLTHDGQTLCLSDWAALTGIGRMTLCKRLEAGWTPADALSRPVRRGSGYTTGRSASGTPGVYRCNGKWAVKPVVDGRTTYHGIYCDLEQARAVAKQLQIEAR